MASASLSANASPKKLLASLCPVPRNHEKAWAQRAFRLSVESVDLAAGSLSEQVSEQHEILAVGKICQAVSFHRREAGIYYILPAEDHKHRISERLTRFLVGEWGKHFRAC